MTKIWISRNSKKSSTDINTHHFIRAAPRVRYAIARGMVVVVAATGPVRDCVRPVDTRRARQRPGLEVHVLVYRTTTTTVHKQLTLQSFA